MTQAELRNYLPFIGIRDGCILSRRGDMTFGWRIQLPTAYNVSEEGYDSIISSFIQAYRLLPPWCVVHKQDVYKFDYYAPELRGDFLSDSFERHFEGRPFLNGHCFLFLTFSNKSNITGTSNDSAYYGILDKKIPDEAAIKNAFGIAGQFAAVLDGNPHISLTRLSDSDLLDAEPDGIDRGVIPDFFRFWEKPGADAPMEFSPDNIRIGRTVARCWYVEDSDSYPSSVNSVSHIDSMSAGDKSKVFLSGGAQIGYLLRRPHVVNRYVFTLPKSTVERELDEKRRLMSSFSMVSAACRVNFEEITAYMEQSARDSDNTVKCFTDLIAWGAPEEMPDIRNDVVTAFSRLNITVCEETVAAPLLHYAAIPGAAAELGYDFLMTSELNAFLSTGLWDGYDRGFRRGCIKLCDRNLHIPVTLDIQDDARSLGYIDNLNALIVGPSGTGKSFTTNTLVRNYYASGQHIVIIDIGDSYQGLCSIVNEQSGGADGVYYTYDAESFPEFNPFLGRQTWGKTGDDGQMENSGRDFIMSLLKTMYVPFGGWTNEMSNILESVLSDFFVKWDTGCPDSVSLDLKAAYVNALRKKAAKRGDGEFDAERESRGWVSPVSQVFREGRSADPVFDDFYQFVTLIVGPLVEDDNYCVGNVTVRSDMFDVNRFGIALDPYRRGGKYGAFLNAEHEKDLFRSRLTVFEVDKIKDNRDLFPLLVLSIMHKFEDKMRALPCQKVMIIEEAWKAISIDTMANFIVWMWRTARKFRTSAVVVTQSMDDLLSSEIVRDAIIQNSSVKILLDQSKNAGNFDHIADVLALSERDVSLVLSVGRNLNPDYLYREAFFSIGERYSNVFAIEVSEEEALLYESEKTKKRELFELAKKEGGIRNAVTILADRKRRDRRRRS